MATIKTPKKTTKRPYKVEMMFNELKFRKQTDDIAKAIMELKPEQLYTDLYVVVTKGKDRMERHLNLRQGKTLFLSEDFLGIFINNLMLK